MKTEKSLVPMERIERLIHLFRGHRIIIDSDLAAIYGVSTKAFNQAVKRNLHRFPGDFMFRLTKDEKNKLVTNCDHLSRLKYSPTLPFAFTEHGAIMAASVSVARMRSNMVFVNKESKLMKSSQGPGRVILHLVSAALIAMFFIGCSLPDCESKPSHKEDEKVQEEVNNYNMKIPLPLTQELIWELAGSEAIKKAGLTSVAGMQIANPEFEKLMLKAGIVSSAFISDWIGFARIDQSKEAFAYFVLTFKDNTVVTGKYSMIATLRKGYTGGPIGSATERYIEVSQLKLAQRTMRPGKKVFESPRVVVPGERITRMISPKEASVDDTYLIDFGLPPNTKVWVDFFGEEKARQPLIDRNVDRHYELKITNEAGLEIPFESFNSRDFFTTREVEKYLLRITAKMRSDNRPDRYMLIITFGGFPCGGDDYDDSWPKWSSEKKKISQ